jgi:hypothetical protein
MEQAIRMVVLHVAIDTFGAKLSAVEREFLPGLKTDHVIVANLKLDAALLATETTVGFDELLWLAPSAPSSVGLVI